MCALFITPMFFVPRVGSLWDILMLTGLLALALMAVLPLLTTRYALQRGVTPTAARTAGRLHDLLSYVTAGLIVLHVAGLLVTESRTVEYLKLTAPWYMLAGILSTLLVAAIIVTGQERYRRRFGYRRWRGTHAVLSVMTIGFALWHVLGSGYYFTAIWVGAVIVIVTFVPTVLGRLGSAR